MIEQVKMIIYKIGKCGFYSTRRSGHLFCNINELLAEYMDWVKTPGKNLIDTSTYEAADGDEYLRTFCYDIDYNKTTNTYLICTWNEIPSSDGEIPSLPTTAQIGNGVVKFTKLPPNSIPGYATYFYFSPDEEIFATVIFDGLLNGRKAFSRSLKSYMETFSKYVVNKVNEEGENVILGYRKEKNEEPIHAEIYFQSYLYENPGEIDLLRKSVNRISKIHRKAILDYSVGLDLDVWQKLMTKIGLSQHTHSNNQQKLKYEMNIELTSTEFDNILKQWELERSDKYSDFGFSITGEPSSKIHWLSKSMAIFRTEVDIDRKDKQIINLASLHNSIVRQKSKVTGTMQ